MPFPAPAAPPRSRAHLSSASDNWPTPQDFFDALDAEFGFVLDVCASTTNHKAPAYFALDHADPTRRDGLTADWATEADRLGGAIWMNSPYGRPIGAWMAATVAAARAGATVVALVPVRADTAWWHDYVLATGAEVRFVRGRLTFGGAAHTAAFASAVVIFRPTDRAGAPGPVTTMANHPRTGRTDATPPTPARAALQPAGGAPLQPAADAGPVAGMPDNPVPARPAAAPQAGIAREWGLTVSVPRVIFAATSNACSNWGAGSTPLQHANTTLPAGADHG